MEPLGQRTNKLNQLFLSKSRGVLTTALRTHLSRDGLVDALLALYGECSQEQLMRNKHADTFVTKFKDTVSEVKKLQISINDFEVKDVIGRGHFGQVQVVREKVTGDVYAMKVLHKADTLSKENVAFYEEERDIMARASSHWLTRLQYAFQDDDNLYLIMEFHPGGDLLSLLARFDDVFEEPMARFYLAELVAAIHSLHTMGYVHRDIKPDNILLDRTGHIKLADFGSSAKLGKDGTVLSKMPVGTPDYVAPEVLMSLNGSLDSQYGTECDWWSLGIVAYEMMAGKTPFSSDSMVVTYSNIMDYKRKLSFPSNPAISPRAASLIKQLLCDRAERIGYEGLGCHAFFSGIEWATLRDGVPPFVPTVSSVDDVSNFDEFDPVEPRSHNASTLMRNRGGFSGHDLPFVGFTYTKTATGSSSSEMSLLNTTLSSPLDTSTMPDQRLQDRCRRLESQHSALTRQNNGISKTLKEKADALKQVQAEKTVLERDLAEAVSELTKLKRVLEKERSGQKDVDSQAVRMLEEIRHTSKKEQELREEEWRSELEEYKQAFSQMEIDRHVAVKRAEKLEAELRQKNQDCADFQTQISSVKSKLNKTTEGSRSEVVELQAQLQKLSHSSQSQLDELRHKLQEAAEAESRATRTAERLRKEKAELREAVQEQCRGSVQELRATVMDLQQQLQESQDDQRSLENRLKMVHEREARLKEQVESKHTLTQDLASKIVDMEENLTATQRMCKQLERDLVVKEREINGRERELKQQRAEATRTMNKVSSLQADCEGSHLKKIAEQAESIAVLDNQVKVLQAQIDKMVANRHHVLQQEQKELKRVENEKFSDLNQDRLYLQTQVGRLEFELKQTQRAKTSLTDQSKDLQQKLDKAADKYEEEIYVLRDKLRQAQVKNERLEVSRQQVEASESELKQQVRTLQTKLQDEVESAAMKIDNLEGEKKLLDQELRVLRERSATVTTLETQLREKADQCSGLLQEKQELVGRCEAFAMEKGKLVSQSQQMEATLSDSQNKLGQNELNINMLKTTCTMLEQQVEDLDTITDRLEARLEECRQARDSAREELQQKDVALQGVTKSLEEAQQAVARTEEKLRELAETLDEKEKTHSDELDSWHKQFNEQRERINQLEENLSDVEKQRALLDVAVKELKQKYSDEQEDNIKLEKEMEEMDEKLKESKGINFQLTQCLEEAVSKGERIKEEKEEVENQLENQEIQHHHEKVKFEGTVAQQTKLIDFLQAKVDAPPKKKKGRLFGRTQQSAYGVASTGITGITYPMQIKELQQKLDAERSRAWELQKALDRARSDLQAAKLKATTTSSDFGSELSLPDLPSTPGFTQAANLISAIVQSPGNRGASPSSLILPTPGDKRTKALTNTGKGTMKRLKERMKHNIPHRFTVGLSMRGTKCAACADNIHFGRQVAKCQECHLICHPKCAHCLPHTCGLPFQFMRHFKQVMDGSPATTPRSVSSASSTASSTVSSSSSSFGQGSVVSGNTNLSCCQIQGWMKTPRSNKQGWEKKWVCLEGTKLCLYDKENSSGSGAPILEYDLCPTDGVVTVHAGVSSAELPRTASSDLPFVFRVESRPITTCWPDTKTLYLMAPSFQDKQQWMVGVEVATIRGRNAGPDGSMRDRARLIGNTLLKLNQTDRLDINCTLLINDGILLIGAEEGLYTMLLMDRQKPLSQLGGVSSVFQMQTITQLSLTVMITGPERKLSIVDLRHLRMMSSQATVSEVDIDCTDIQGIESCHLFAAGKVDGSFYLCAAMPTKISILKYSEGLSKFCVRKEIQTAEPCSCLLFTERSILAGTDRFYEIELNDFKIDEFLESTDTSLAFAVYGASQLDSFPISAIQVAPDGEPEEFLLCFHEFGIFVDSKGRRSRPDDMKWSRLPLAFTYRQPYLYMAHFNSVEVCEIKQNGDTESPANRTFMDMASPRFVGPAITPGAVYIASLGDRNVELMCLQGNCASGPRENTSALDTSSSTVGDSVSCTGVEAAARNQRAMGPPPPPVTTVKRTPSQECRTPNVTPRRATRSSMKRPLQESYDNTPRGKFSRTSARASARLPSASSSSEDELRRTKCGIKFGSTSGRKTRSMKR